LKFYKERYPKIEVEMVARKKLLMMSGIAVKRHMIISISIMTTHMFLNPYMLSVAAFRYFLLNMVIPT
jgi:hypothetical protein